MKKLRYLIIAATIFMSFSIKANALDSGCTQSDIIYLREKASEVKITSEYVESYEGFKINVNNLPSILFVYNETNGVISYVDGNTLSKDNFLPGKNYQFEIFASKAGPCFGTKIADRSILLPYYNKYHKDPICVGYEDYELCKKFTNLKLPAYDELITRIKNYIKSKEIKPIKEVIKEEKKYTQSTFEKVLVFFTDYYLYITIPIIFVGTISIVIIEVRKRRERIL